MYKLLQTCDHCQLFIEITIDFNSVSQELHIGARTNLQRGFKIMHKATGRKHLKPVKFQPLTLLRKR